jgi:tetratricopeptide (TPR) repeat protein
VTGTRRSCAAVASLGLISLLNACSDDAPIATPGQVRFADVTRDAGIDFVQTSGSETQRFILESMPSGSAFLDFDGDGYQDLFLVDATRVDSAAPGAMGRLYHNIPSIDPSVTGRAFEDVTEEFGLQQSGWGMGSAVGDYDNDGDVDLYVSRWGPNILYRNDYPRTFTDVTDLAGVGDTGWGASAGFADLDADGFVDLFVTNYLVFDLQNPPGGGEPCPGWKGLETYCGPMGMEPQANVLYRNDKDGSFSDVSEATGIGRTQLPSLGVLFTDFDDDGDADIYVANDSEPNKLFRNEGDWRFTDVASLSGVAYSEDGRAQAGMGVAAGDFDNDQDLDLFVTNFSDDINTLYRNAGSGRFEEGTAAAGLDGLVRPYLGWSTLFFDADRDGWLDLLAVNGHIYPQVDEQPSGIRYAQRNLFYHNRAGRFEEQGAAAGFTRVAVSRGASFGDYDNDGDPDVLVMNLNSRPTLLANLTRNPGHWVGLQLQGVTSNRDALGARVQLCAGDLVQTREVSRTHGYLSQSDARLLFGLGANVRVDSVAIRWPSGRSQVLYDLPIDRYLVIREDDAVVATYRGEDGEQLQPPSRDDEVGAKTAEALPVSANPTPDGETGIQLYREGRYQEALAELRGAVAGGGALRDRYALAVVLYGGLGRATEAVAVLTEALQMAPGSVKTNELLGTVWLSLDRADSAEIVLARAVSLAPADWELRNLLGLAHLRQADLASAEGSFRAAVLRAPWEPHPHLNLAQILARQGNPSASRWEHDAFEKLDELRQDVEWYSKELARQPATPRLHVLLGRTYLLQGRYDRSAAQFQDAVRLDSSFALAFYGMGAAYHFQGRLTQAIEAFERAVAADSTLVLALNDLGAAYQRAGRLEEAANTFRKAMALRPDLGLSTAGTNLAAVEAAMSADGARAASGPASATRPPVVSPRSGREKIFSP